MTADQHSKHWRHLSEVPAGRPSPHHTGQPGTSLTALQGAVGMAKCVIADAHGELSAAEFVEFSERVRRFLRVQAAA
jgi:hypothetical protein